MESLIVAWRFLVLISFFALPQLLGILLYFRLSRAPRWVAVIAGAVAPAVVFFLLARIFIVAEIREIQARGDMCGMPIVAALILLYMGTIIQLVLGLVSQLILRAIRR